MPIPPSRNRFLKKFFVLRIPGIFWRQIWHNKFVPGILREGIWLTEFLQTKKYWRECAQNFFLTFWEKKFGAANSHIKVLRQRNWWVRVLEKVLRG